MEVKVIEKINHNGKDYAPGDVIKKIKAEDAQRLIELEVAEELIDSSSDASPEDEDFISEEEAKKND